MTCAAGADAAHRVGRSVGEQLRLRQRCAGAALRLSVADARREVQICCCRALGVELACAARASRVARSRSARSARYARCSTRRLARRAGGLHPRRARVLRPGFRGHARRADPAAGDRAAGRAGAGARSRRRRRGGCSIWAPAAAASRSRSRKLRPHARVVATDAVRGGAGGGRAQCAASSRDQRRVCAPATGSSRSRRALRSHRLQSALRRRGRPASAQGDLRFEPQSALVGRTRTASSALRAIIAAGAAHLLPGGWLLLEHGYDQADAVRGLLSGAGFDERQFPH